MFISNETLVNKYFDTSIQEKDFLRYFLLIKQLIKTYGKRSLDTATYLESLKKHSSETYEIVMLLKSMNKLELKHINQITLLLKKKYADTKKEFSITTDKDTQNQIGSFVTDTFKNVDLTYQDSSKVGVDVKGEGYRYKRDLDRDLNLLLG
jgi:hypothetical protein